MLYVVEAVINNLCSVGVLIIMHRKARVTFWAAKYTVKISSRRTENFNRYCMLLVVLRELQTSSSDYRGLFRPGTNLLFHDQLV